MTGIVNHAILHAVNDHRNTSADPNPDQAVPQLGPFLKSTRESHGWTLEQLAKRLQVTKGYISRIERGKVKPAATLINILAQTWQIDPSMLLILAGHLPTDLEKILLIHPVAAPRMLRKSFGTAMYDRVSPDVLPLRVREERFCRTGHEPQYKLVEGDCLSWMAQRRPNTIHTIVTDPPYGLKEYTPTETAKLRRGKGGVWRMPPVLNGYARQPLPRFTVLGEREKSALKNFFVRWAINALRILVPGGHVFIATNPLLSHIVYIAMMEAGFEKRGEIIRLVQTLRGGDRPKNAHKQFEAVTVMPRSCWEPWGLFRKPCQGRVQDNLRKWKTGGLLRISDDQPFCDVIRSYPTRSVERNIAPHPSLKPQAFMRQIVRASLPVGEGIVLDPFMGGGSTIAAATAVGYQSIGIEIDPTFFAMATQAIPRLATFVTTRDTAIHHDEKGMTSPHGQSTLFK